MKDDINNLQCLTYVKDFSLNIAHLWQKLWILLLSFRKAVARASAVHNLVVYVAQDCTGDEYKHIRPLPVFARLLLILNYCTWLKVSSCFFTHHALTHCSVQRGCDASVWPITEPDALWSRPPILAICHHTSAGTAGRRVSQSILHRMCQGVNILCPSVASTSIFIEIRNMPTTYVSKLILKIFVFVFRTS